MIKGSRKREKGGPLPRAPAALADTIGDRGMVTAANEKKESNVVARHVCTTTAGGASP